MVCTEGIQLFVFRHVTPVNATHIFTPAKDLPDETLHACQRSAALFPFVLRCGDDASRVEEF